MEYKLTVKENFLRFMSGEMPEYIPKFEMEGWFKSSSVKFGNGYVKEYDEQMPAAEEAETYLGSDQTLRMQPVLKSFNRAYAPIRVSPDAAFSIAGRVLN